MPQFVWITEGCTTLFEAKDDEEAYLKVIANRVGGDLNSASEEEIRDAVRWFRKNDRIEQIEAVGLDDVEINKRKTPLC